MIGTGGALDPVETTSTGTGSAPWLDRVLARMGVKKRPSLFVVYTSGIATIVYVFGFLAFYFLIISDSDESTELKDNGLFLPWLFSLFIVQVFLL